MTTGRTCSTCTMCCRLFAIPGLKTDKAWCPHCAHGKGGCAIYAERPQLCREFECQYLINPLFGDEWFPHRAKIVAVMQGDEHGGKVCRFYVDDRHPGRWRQQPYLSLIERIAHHVARSGQCTVEVIDGEPLDPPVIWGQRTGGTL